MMRPSGIPPYREDRREPPRGPSFSVMPLITLLVIAAVAYYGAILLIG